MNFVNNFAVKENEKPCIYFYHFYSFYNNNFPFFKFQIFLYSICSRLNVKQTQFFNFQSYTILIKLVKFFQMFNVQAAMRRVY